MGDADNLHSQMVGWAKIVLPLCALGILSTLFLFARDSNDLDTSALEQAEEIARAQRVTAPEFAGVTDDGSVVVIAAKSAQPDATRLDTVQIDDISMRLDTPEGNFLTVNATKGEVDGRAQIASFLGLARLETSTGYALETNGLMAELATGRITSEGLLEIRAPFGQLTAGKVTFEPGSSDQGQQMLFTNGVRLLYTSPRP
jgi:lipopolysaccharide export system protein LptC